MSSPPLFCVDDLHARPADVEAQRVTGEILRGLDLTVMPGEVHAIIGPNGSGKSTLAASLLGSPDYEITAGSITFLGDDVTTWPVDERAKAGMFVAFQRPQEIPGVSVTQFLRHALSTRSGTEVSITEVRSAVVDRMQRLGLNSSFAERYLDDGLSGGEKKRIEVVQLAILGPELAILDDIDAGLDLEALRVVAQGIRDVHEERESMGVVLITHNRRLLEEVEPDHVHILVDGRIVQSGGIELAEHVERSGDESFGTLTIAGAVN